MSAKRLPKPVKVSLIGIGSLIGVVVIGVAAVVSIGGVLSPAHYLEPWAEDYADRFEDPRMKVVAQAELAPSGHNMQPWRVTLDRTDRDVLFLYADSTRLTPAVDPVARQTMLSQGAFLGYLQVSAAELGYSTDIEMFPSGPYDETDTSSLMSSMSAIPVARVTMTEDATLITPDHASLFLSDTNRSPYTDMALSTAEVDALTGLAVDSGASMEVMTGTEDLTILGNLAIEGTRIETEYAAATEETAAVFHGSESSKNEYRSGFAVEGRGTSGFMKYFMQGLITMVPSLNDDEASATAAIESTNSAVAHTPAYAMISTASNTRSEQVRAGMLYAETSLRARTLGLVTQPLSQVLQEYPTMSGPFAAIHRRYAPEQQTIQMLVRVGSPTTAYPPTMRRDATEIVSRP